MINKVFNYFFGKTKVSYFKKQNLIINFNKDLTNQVRVIDLNEYKNFSILVEKEDTVTKYLNNYKLVLENNNEKLVLAYFETEKDAQNASLELINKMYDRFITINYFIIKCILVMFFALFIVDTLKVNLTNQVIKTNDTNKMNIDNNMLNEQTLNALKNIQSQQQMMNEKTNTVENVQNNQEPSINMTPGPNNAQNVLNALK